MSPRVEFDGKGERIPTEALPGFGNDGNIPPTTLIFNDSADLGVQTYRDLGYTHFEVWTIGGAGGSGGDILEPSNADSAAYRVPAIRRISFGGEGGGGGLQAAAGTLESLPDLVPIVVGKRGAEGANGIPAQRWFVATAIQDFAGQPMMLAVVRGAKNIPGMTDAAGNAIPPYFFAEQAIYIPPGSSPSNYLFYLNPFYVAPQDGGDGGYSSFNGALCQASGGRGGKKTPVYRNSFDDQDRLSSAYWDGPGGDGGEGGTGGRTAVGGGGLGATVSPPQFNDVPGTSGYREQVPRVYTAQQDGSWDGSVGKGGGGGRGGSYTPPGFMPGGGMSSPPVVLAATNGGNGSFNYGDTSVFGVKGSYADYHSLGTIVPGAGGGARVLGKQNYGSRAPSYSPDGVVVVRLTRIVD